MTMWTPDLSRADGPIYRSLADAVAVAIETGALSPGARLPTQRDLAETLGIALTTVTRGYAEAERRGLVRGEVGRGTFVRTRVIGGERASPNGEGLDLRANTLLPWQHGPELLDAMARLITAGDPSHLFGYTTHRGQERHREAGAAWIRRRGLSTDADEVLVTVGGQHAMLIAFATLASPGDDILVEEVTYSGMRALAHMLGLRLRPLAMDAEGIRPDALRAACGEGSAKAIYCTATLQNPTAAVMSDERKREIAAIAAHAGVPIVEDDSYGFILPDVTPLAAFAEGALYLFGTSKSLFPALRVGFLRAPRAMIPRLESAIAASAYMTSPLLAEIVTDWLYDGTVDRIMAWKREQFAVRQGIARRLFAGWEYHAHPRSPHGWLKLPEPWTTGEFVSQAGLRGVHVSPADDFATSRTVAHAIRLCVGPTPSRAHLEQGLTTLVTMLRTGPEAGRVVV